MTGKNSVDFEVAESSLISNLKKALINEFPKLKNIDEFAIAINEEYATDNSIINKNDVIAIIPPVSGG